MKKIRRAPAAALILASLLMQACTAKQCDEGAGGSGQIEGDVLGNQLQKIVAAYKLGNVDEPGITVLFAFDTGVTCCEMHDAGWDERVQNGTRLLEIALYGTTPGTYPISAEPEPAEGEASFAVKSKSAAGLEESAATAGSVTIDSIDGDNVIGSFDVTFQDGHASGTISTTACAEGREP